MLRFERSDNEERVLVLLNLGNSPAQVDDLSGTILLSTSRYLPGVRMKSILGSAEGVIVALAD